jgi:mono/diheme cytochrome c family protein
MKTKLIFSLIFLTLVLTACGGQAVMSEPAAPSQVAAQPIVIPTLTVASPMEAAPTAAVPATEVPATEAPAAAATGGVSFANDVMPILSGSCTECHGGNQTKAGLDLTKYEGLMAGSFNGVVVVPGNSADSLLVQLVAEGKMPKRGPKLSAEQVQIISDWIAAGALNN